MNVKKTLTVSVAALALAGCGEKDDGRLVARRDYDVPAAWALRTFGGSDFHTMFYPDSQSVQDPSYGKVDPSWDLDIFRECSVEYSGKWGCHCATKFMRDHRTRKILPVTNGTYKVDYTLRDYFDDRTWKMLSKPGDPKRPYFLGLSDARPSFLLEKDYPRIDRAGFAAWKAEHPEFVGFMTLGEFDSETTDYLARRKNKETPPEVLNKLTEGYPDPTGQYGLYAYAKESFRREKAMHFGSDDLWTLHSSCWSLAHVMANLGAAGFFYEATGQEFANWRMAGAYSRGAARQWKIPFGWYTAHWYTGYVRGKYDKVTQGSNYWTGDATPGYKGVSFASWRGLSRSLLDRQNAFGWLIGASFLQVEDWVRLYRAPAADGQKGFRPHEVAQDLENLYALTKKTDRGVVYAPCAILTPISELIGPSGLSHAEEKHNLNAFFFTLVPVSSEDIAQRSLKRKGEQGCLFNSPFGDFFDIVTPDADQSVAEMTRTLGAYKCAFLAGGYRKEDLKSAALVDYVKDGGTLFISSDRILDGLFPASVAGVFFKTETVASGKALVDARTGAETALTAPYKWNIAGEGSTAKVVMTDDLGTPVVWANRFGKGRVVTVACWRMMPAEYLDDYDRINNVKHDGDARWGVVTQCFSGKRQFEVIRTLLAKAQAETMPVTVEGDIQWGVNRAKSGWLVWLMNNKGVIHYANEPEEFDLTKTAEVRVTFKPTGKVHTATVKPGEWKLVKIEE